MKEKYHFLIGVVIIMLVGIAMSGCVSKMSPPSTVTDSTVTDPMDYLRQHKGEGTRRTLLGSEAELMDVVVKRHFPGHTYLQEPHAELDKDEFKYGTSSAIYFYPSQTNGQTEVEVLSVKRKSNSPSSFGTLFEPVKILPDSLERDEGTERGKFVLMFLDKRVSSDLAISDIDFEINEMNKTVSEMLRLDPSGSRAFIDSANSTIEELKRFKRKVKQSDVEKVTDARFQEALRTSQKSAIKLQLPEAARRYKVLAEDAIREKKFDDAVDLFGQALDIAPLWPEGHFNRALILGETGDYGMAAREMKRYLLLVPNASDARAAQDKIYVWESKVQK